MIWERVFYIFITLFSREVDRKEKEIVKYSVNVKHQIYTLKSTVKYGVCWHLEFLTAMNFYPHANIVNLPQSHNYMLRIPHYVFW